MNRYRQKLIFVHLRWIKYVNFWWVKMKMYYQCLQPQPKKLIYLKFLHPWISTWLTIVWTERWLLPIWSAVSSHHRNPGMAFGFIADTWAISHLAPLSLGFSRQEYWSGLPFSSPGDLPGPGIKPESPALQADFLLSELPGEPTCRVRPPLLVD